MEDIFHAIRPYNQQEAKSAIAHLFANDDFVKALQLFEPNISVKRAVEEAAGYDDIYDFQLAVAKDFVEYFIQNTTKGVEVEGLENLEKDKAYLFVANHRDIVFDSALLQYYFMANNYPTSKIAIGDNLLATPLLETIGKLNKMITVIRSAQIREKLQNYRLLSEYLYHSIVEEKESVWIAQRNGRTKDGIDRTQHGLVKMFTMFDTKNPIDALKKLNVVPVTISYEYEVCDNLKARELALSENQSYEKKPGEDFESIRQGLYGQKGRVKLVIGKSLNEELNALTKGLGNKDTIDEVCKIIDKQIYQSYKLFPNNYIAYDYLNNSTEFATHYSEKEKRNFLDYLDEKSVTEDVAKEKMLNYLLQIYANPVDIIHHKIDH